VDRFGCDAVLFDLDGVLVNSTPSVERAWRGWADLHGLDVAAILAVAHGRRTAETISLVAPHLDAEAEAKRLETKEIEGAANVHPIEGAAALLETLPSERWAVVTSGTRALAHARLRACGLPIPKTFVSAEDVRVGKPHPECYLRGAKLLGVGPDRCVVIEDAPSGIAAGRAAGAAVIAVTTTHPAAELSEANAVTETVGSLQARRNTDPGGYALEIVIDRG
jgi:sugar-phosphatase